jgi:PAS domain S-box-containing protein
MERATLSPSTASLDADSVLPMIRGLARLHDHVALFDGDGRIVWLSDALASACGGARRFKGLPWTALLAEPDRDGHLARRLSAEGRLSNEPLRLAAGAAAPTAATISAARLGPPRDCGASVAIFRVDPAESDRLDRELRLRLDYLAAILDSAPEGVVVIDRSRFITYANPAMREITGYAAEELMDRPLALFLRSQEDVDRIATALQPGGGCVRNHDLEVRRRDGRSLCVSVSASLLRLSDGTPLGAVAYVRDVSERRRAEEDLARKNAELEHYVHAVSHDLRSPLVALLGFSRLLREDFVDALGPQGCHFVRRIEEAGRTMEALIQDLLELSRIGRSRLHKEWVEPREVMLQLQAEIKPRLEKGGVTLRIPDAPPLLHCDRTRLYQILSNLIGNALDHMGPCEDPTVSVEVREEPGGQVLVVRDNGRGVDPDDQERIFELFQSLSGRRGDGGGTGIGLAIVKRIAETHGGRAWVESRPGRGAAFHVFLPSA